MDIINKLVAERPVVIFSRSTCAMCHTVRTVFTERGVNPMVHEVDKISSGREIEQALSSRGCSPPVPTVFIGGDLVGGTNEVMSLLLNQSLIPRLIQAGAIWL